VNSVAFTPDGSILAVGMADRTVHLWRLDEPTEPVPLGPSVVCRYEDPGHRWRGRHGACLGYRQPDSPVACRATPLRPPWRRCALAIGPYGLIATGDVDAFVRL
jgi:hypothetical protein